MEYSFLVTAVLNLEYKSDKHRSAHVSTNIGLEVSENLNKETYLDKDNNISKDGSQAITMTLVQGLVANVHMTHESGYRDPKEHLDYIIKELKRGVSQKVEITKN